MVRMVILSVFGLLLVLDVHALIKPSHHRRGEKTSYGLEKKEETKKDEAKKEEAEKEEPKKEEIKKEEPKKEEVKKEEPKKEEVKKPSSLFAAPKCIENMEKPTVAEKDMACTADYECQVVEMDCCDTGEEQVAVNKSSALRLIGKMSSFCAEERCKNKDLCYGKKALRFLMHSAAACIKKQCVVY